MQTIRNAKNAGITRSVIEAIHENAAYLSEIDGATGDGDHGVNMNKGFLLAGTRIGEDMGFSESLLVLGDTLIMDIGGSMGPIYGTLFSTLGEVLEPADEIGAPLFAKALDDATQALMDLAGARLGDKTLVDTIYPAAVSFRTAVAEGRTFEDCLSAMACGAEHGKESTRQMQARIGRAARLGERSIGFLDAGATSCCIILQAMSGAMQPELQGVEK